MNFSQKELNKRIATELDKHCIQSEYACLLLDQDKEIRNRYKWFFNIRIPSWIEIVTPIIAAIIGAISNIQFFYYLAISLLLLFGILIAIRYYHRKEIAKLIPRNVKSDLEKIYHSHAEYVSKLRLWFMQVGADKKTNRQDLNDISVKFSDASISGNKDYDKLSSLFGLLQDELHLRAKNKAESKLTQLLTYYIQ